MKQPITNNTAGIIFENGHLIQPGETRYIDVIPSAKKPSFDPKLTLDRPVNALENSLTELTLDELNQVKVAEEAGDNRKTAIKLIETEIEKREYDAELSEFALSLSSVDNLDELGLSVAGDETKLAMVEQEKLARAGNNNDDNH